MQSIIPPVTRKLFSLAVAVLAAWFAQPVAAAPAAYHHVHLNVPKPDEGARWYITHMECKAFPGRPTIADCGTALLVFSGATATGPSVGTGVNHIGFSFRNLDAKAKALETAGVTVTDPVRDIAGLFKIAFVRDPWGTRIELVEHAEFPGFHHVHLSSIDPDQTLSWYQRTFGGERTKMKGMLDAVLFTKVWVLAGRSKEPLAPTPGRVIDHVGFMFQDLDAAASEMTQAGVPVTRAGGVEQPNALLHKRSLVTGPDGVRIEIAEPPAR